MAAKDGRWIVLGINLEFDYMWRDKKVAHVRVYSDGKITCDCYTNDPMDNPLPLGLSGDLLVHFFESRCFPRERANANALLKHLGLDYYTPLGIVKKTRGLQNDDFYWIKFKGDNAEWKDIKLRE